MRALLVVVGHELGQNALGVASAAYEDPVQAFCPSGPDKSFGERVRLGVRTGVFMTRAPTERTHPVKGPNELGVPVTDEVPDGAAPVVQVRNP